MAATATRQTAIHRRLLVVLLAGACMGGCEHSPPAGADGDPSASSDAELLAAASPPYERASLAAARTLAARAAERPESLAALRAALDDPARRDGALIALGRAGEAASSATPRVVEIVRAGAAPPALALWCLGRIGARDDDARATLWTALRADGTPPALRREIALALLEARGFDGRELDELVRALGSPLPYPALLRAGPAAWTRAQVALERALDGPEEQRAVALRVLADLAPAASLAALLGRDDPALQSVLSRGAYRVVEELRAGAPVRDPALLGELARQLAGARPAGRASAGLLLEQTVERLGEEGVAVERLGAWIAGDGAARPALGRALGDPRPTVRKAAARAIWAVGGLEPGELEALRGCATEDPDPEVRQAARAALERAAPRARP